MADLRRFILKERLKHAWREAGLPSAVPDDDNEPQGRHEPRAVKIARLAREGDPYLAPLGGWDGEKHEYVCKTYWDAVKRWLVHHLGLNLSYRMVPRG